MCGCGVYVLIFLEMNCFYIWMSFCARILNFYQLFSNGHFDNTNEKEIWPVEDFKYENFVHCLFVAWTTQANYLKMRRCNLSFQHLLFASHYHDTMYIKCTKMCITFYSVALSLVTWKGNSILLCFHSFPSFPPPLNSYLLCDVCVRVCARKSEWVSECARRVECFTSISFILLEPARPRGSDVKRRNI